MEFKNAYNGNNEVSLWKMKFPGKMSNEDAETDSTVDILMNKRITGIFLMLGMPTKIKGYRYLKEAVSIAVRDVNSTDRMREDVYKKVAEKFKEDEVRNVERACAYAVNIACNSGKMENINNLLGVIVYKNRHEKPSAGEFISLIADRIRLEFIK